MLGTETRRESKGDRMDRLMDAQPGRCLLGEIESRSATAT